MKVLTRCFVLQFLLSIAYGARRYKGLTDDCRGNDISWHKDKNIEECELLCDDVTTCAGFTYAHGSVDGRVGEKGCCLKSQSCGNSEGSCDPSKKHCFYVKHGKFGYFLGPSMNFDDAKKWCEIHEISTLAMIKNAESQKKAAEVCDGFTCWIGLVKHGGKSGSLWKWLDGDNLTNTYSNWQYREPNDVDWNYATMNCCSKDEQYKEQNKWFDAPANYGDARPLCFSGGGFSSGYCPAATGGHILGAIGFVHWITYHWGGSARQVLEPHVEIPLNRRSLFLVVLTVVLAILQLAGGALILDKCDKSTTIKSDIDLGITYTVFGCLGVVFATIALDKLCKTKPRPPIDVKEVNGVNHVDLELQPQPTIANTDILVGITPQNNIELEQKRREYFKRSDHIPCPQCQPPFSSSMTASVAPDAPGNKLTGQEDDLCWMCLGTGKTSKHIAELSPPPESGLDCLICYDKADYGLSDVCTHFFCTTCIRRSLETCLDAGEIPMYCPACKATHEKKKSAAAKIGRIETPTLTFLARRNVISRDLQFRIMMAERKKRNASEQGKEFFPCPGKCGNYLIHEDPQAGMKVQEGKNGYKMVSFTKPGRCKCGVLCCVKCHIQLTEKSMLTHDCDKMKANAEMDKASLAILQKNAKACPNCGAWVQKTGGCDTMMCGTHSHGSIVTAIRNGGCGHQFAWSSLQPCSTFYTGIYGERRSGKISKEYRLKAMEYVFGKKAVALKQS